MTADLEERVAKVETKVEDYCVRMDKFIDNEFPHAIDRLEKKIDKIIWALVAGFIAIVVFLIKGHIAF